MFKTINKLKTNRGFTLTELLVTCVIMALVAGTIALIAGNIWRDYRLVENRYIVQTEVKAIADAFTSDASTGSLSTATNVDLLYEDMDNVISTKSFTSCPELGSFTEDEDTHLLTFEKRSKSYIAQLEGKLSNNGSLSSTEKLYYNAYKYTYLFVYDNHFYVLNGNKDTAYRYYYIDEVKVNVNYSVSVDAFHQVLDDSTNDYIEAESRADNKAHEYINAVTISISSDPEEYNFKYELLTSFSLKNISGDNFVNMNNEDGIKLSNAYIAGYTSGKIINYPSGDKLISGVNDTSLQRQANIIKYISLSEFNSSNATGNNGSANVGFNCSTTFLMTGSKISEGVLNTLRDFRDSIKGTYLGDMFISIYYKSSPNVIKFLNKHNILKCILKYNIECFAYAIEISKVF